MYGIELVLWHIKMRKLKKKNRMNGINIFASGIYYNWIT